MAFVSVPKDLTKVKNKIIFNLTKRQLICFGIAAAVGLPFYFLSRGIIGSSNAATGMCLLMLPAFLFAMYEKDGLPLEKVLKNMITVKFIRPPVRKYQMENMYEKKYTVVKKKKGGTKGVKKKNDRQPPQSLDELYPDDYWLDEEDGEEELPDPAMKRKPVSGRLHDEPMVTGYEALERRRGVRRPNRKLTRREKKAIKRAQKYEEKLHKEHEKADKKNAKREAKLAARAEKQAVRDAKKNAKRKRADLSQHRRGSVRQEKWFPERKAVGQERKHRIVPVIRGSLHSSRFHTMRWEGTVSAGCRTSFIPRRSVFMTSTISWHRMKIRTPSLKTGVIS